MDTPKPRGELELSLDALEALVEETIHAQNADKDLSSKTLAELDDLEDDFLDDERMLECVASCLAFLQEYSNI